MLNVLCQSGTYVVRTIASSISRLSQFVREHPYLQSKWCTRVFNVRTAVIRYSDYATSRNTCLDITALYIHGIFIKFENRKKALLLSLSRIANATRYCFAQTGYEPNCVLYSSTSDGVVYKQD